MPSSPVRALRWWPALAYPLALAVGSTALAARDGAGKASWLAAASTNLDNLRSHPLRSLAASAVLIDADVAAWVVLAAVGLAGLVAAAGPVRAAAVGVTAHVLGTLVSEGALGVRVAHGLEPEAMRSIVDVGPSFVVVGALVATVVGGRGRLWRLAGALGFGVLVPSLFDGLTQWEVAAVGHVTAVAVGAVSGGLLLAGRARAAGVRPGPETAFDASTSAGLAGRDTPRRRP